MATTIMSIYGGLTKREYFAAMAMQGILANHLFTNQFDNYNEIAEKCYVQADAMLEEGG